MFKYKGLKVKESDATLPKTRKELFKTIVKDDSYLLTEISLILFLFSIPLIVAFVFELMMIAGAYKPGTDYTWLANICSFMGLIEIPLFGIRYFGRYAAFGVMKKRVHNEAGYIKELFFQAMKKGAFRGFLIGLFLGVTAYLWQIATVFVIGNNPNTWIKGLGIGAASLVFMIVYAAVEYFLSVDNFYELKFSGSLKNGFSFAIMHFPMSGLYFIACVGIPFAMLFVHPWIVVGIAGFFALWGDGLSVLCVTLFSHALFDRYINSVYHTDYINKGLAPSGDTDEKESKNG